ncbi:hypothetical protein [Kitasatospora sp. NPDC059327]|uniref:hypothetical protein n=1 Tax=Kitasatospora sp. NPDC059327 TaxID=3346803 RepID=UPI00369ABB19
MGVEQDLGPVVLATDDDLRVVGLNIQDFDDVVLPDHPRLVVHLLPEGHGLGVPEGPGVDLEVEGVRRLTTADAARDRIVRAAVVVRAVVERPLAGDVLRGDLHRRPREARQHRVGQREPTPAIARVEVVGPAVVHVHQRGVRTGGTRPQGLLHVRLQLAVESFDLVPEGLEEAAERARGAALPVAARRADLVRPGADLGSQLRHVRLEVLEVVGHRQEAGDVQPVVDPLLLGQTVHPGQHHGPVQELLDLGFRTFHHVDVVAGADGVRAVASLAALRVGEVPGHPDVEVPAGAVGAPPAVQDLLVQLAALGLLQTAFDPLLGVVDHRLPGRRRLVAR